MQNPSAPVWENAAPTAVVPAHRWGDNLVDPYADLCFADGRRYRVLIEETCVREGDEVRARFGMEARFVVDFEVQSEIVHRWREGGHPQGFRVIVSLDAIRGGVLESVGYGESSLCGRATALLLLARLYVHRFLAQSGGGGGYSLHTRPSLLWVSGGEEDF